MSDWVDGVDVAGPGAGGDARELPPQQGREEERRGAGAQDGRACATSSCTTPSAPRTAPRPRPTASRSSRRSPAPARCWRPRSTRITKALAQPEAAAGGHRRRQQGLAPSSASCSAWPSNVDQLIVGGGIANTFMLAVGLPIGKRLAEADLVEEAKAVIEAMKARGAAVPIPIDVVMAKEFRPTRTATIKAAADVARRRPDPRHRPADRGDARRAAEGGRHHRLERPGGRVRVRGLRPRHRDARARDRGSPARSASRAAATRWRRSPSTASRRTSATSRPAAARSSRCWRARRCRRSRSCSGAPPPSVVLHSVWNLSGCWRG